MSKQEKKKIKMPSVAEALFGKRNPLIFPKIDTSTQNGKREYRRKYKKLLRDQTRQRKYSPRKRKR